LRSIRLIPVVIFAALALLVFKGVGLVTNGGYVLGTQAAVATGAPEGGGGQTGASDGSVSLPSEMTLSDTAPMLADSAPTIASTPKPGEEQGSSHGSSSTSGSSGAEASSEPIPDAVACPSTGTNPDRPSRSPDLTEHIGNVMVTKCPDVSMPVTASGDALPTTKDGNGKIVPLSVADGSDSQDALLARLSERRTQLDQREADLNTREALIAAAEKRLDERTAALQALEDKINSLVDQKQAEEDAQFKAVVSMYENMKPKDAARIFDTLDLGTLLRVAKAMNPRKMSPILAAMSPKPAEALTTAMATQQQVQVAQTGENLASLPQIVGQ
jgi:flagellar motility protein MotE (MotC chaperone)